MADSMDRTDEDRAAIPHCPHCWATDAVPLGSGLYCTNDWHHADQVARRRRPDPIVLHMRGRWAAYVWRVRSIPSRRRARRAYTESMDPAVMQERINALRTHFMGDGA